MCSLLSRISPRLSRYLPHAVDEQAEDVELASLQGDDRPLRREELCLRAVQRQLDGGVLQERTLSQLKYDIKLRNIHRHCLSKFLNIKVN